MKKGLAKIFEYLSLWESGLLGAKILYCRFDKMLPVIFLLFTGLELFSQNQIEYRSDYGKIYPERPNDIVLTRNVVFTHKDMTMYCDSAIYNQKENYFDAFVNIRMYQGDSVSLFGDELHYDGNDKIGELNGNKVTMKDNDVTMTTDYLLLDRNDNTVSYYSYADIWNKKDTLRSKEGKYFIDDEIFQFYHQVDLTSDDGNLTTDTLFYNTKTGEAEFFGKNSVLLMFKDSTKTDTNKVIASYGRYNSKNDIVYSEHRPKIYTKEAFVVADTIYYNHKEKNGYSYGNIYVADTSNDLYLNCDTAYLNTVDTVSTAIVTGRLLVRQIDSDDTLYMHSDTIQIVMDTNYDMKEAFAYRHCKFYRNDMQGACEHAHYNRQDSTLTMTEKPVLWAEESQLTADTIQMLIDEKNVKELYMYPNTFVLQNSDTNTQEFFNQVNGRNLVGYFQKNKLYYAEIDGNTTSIYFLWDESKKNKIKKLTGVNIGTSKMLHLYFKKGELKQMAAVKNPEFYMDSYQNIPESDRRLKGFIYLEQERPKLPEEIFILRK